MQIDAALIQKFCEQSCTPTERDLVMAYLAHHPEEIVKWFKEDEWTVILHPEKLPYSLSQEMLDNIKQELFPQHKSIDLQQRVLRWSAVAAILVAAVTTIMVFSHQKDTPPVTLQQTKHKTIIPAVKDTSWTEAQNLTQKALALVLPDSTTVRLQPHAALRYNKQFNVVRRDVYLSGEALFKVAKNKAKPFTVKTAMLNTTALGTAFAVNTNGNQVTVHLLEGKVVVRAAIALHGWLQDVYLSPGERLNYNKLKAATAIIKPAPVKKKETVRPISSRQDYSFDNTPLNEVMDKLVLSYRCKIAYKGQDIRNMNFTGTISKNDSLPVILNLIANMNNLLIEQQGNNYIIHKH